MTGSVDLTGGKLFLTTAALRHKLTLKVQALAMGAVVDCSGRAVQYHFVLSILTQKLAHMYGFWGKRETLTPDDLRDYSEAVDRFRECWTALKWRGTPWVHWVCAHSTHFLFTHRTWSAFSSIPDTPLFKREE